MNTETQTETVKSVNPQASTSAPHAETLKIEVEATAPRPKNATAPIRIEAFLPEDKKLMKKFIDFEWTVYRSSPEFSNWVPRLKMALHEMFDRKNNPFWKNADIQLFLAYRGDELVGRIAAIENRAHTAFHNDQWGFYGFFECFYDVEVAKRLFDSASSWLKTRGLQTMAGPMNPSTNHECGLLIRGQSQHPTIMTTWNPKYYVALHEAAGLEKAKDLVAYWLPTEKSVGLPPKVAAFAERIKRDARIKFRDFDVKNMEREIEICFEIYNSAWEKNWGFFPMTREEFFHAAKDMKMILDPNFAFIAEVDGKPAGFMLALPDMNHVFKRIPNGKLFPTGLFKLLLGKKFVKTVRIITLGVKPEFRGGGIFAAFTHEAFVRAQKAKIIGGEASWILEDNVPMNKPWQDLGAPLYRRWRLYQRKI